MLHSNIDPAFLRQKYQTDSIGAALITPDNRLGQAFFEHLKISQMMRQKMDTKESII